MSRRRAYHLSLCGGSTVPCDEQQAVDAALAAGSVVVAATRK